MNSPSTGQPSLEMQKQIEAKIVQLEKNTVDTRKKQSTLRLTVLPALVVSFVLTLWQGAVGGWAFVLVIICWGAGFWITGSHLVEFEQRLAELRRKRGV